MTTNTLDWAIKILCSLTGLDKPNPSADKLQWVIEASLEYFQTTDTNSLMGCFRVLNILETLCNENLIEGDLLYEIRWHVWHTRNTISKEFTRQYSKETDISKRLHKKDAAAFFANLMPKNVQEQKRPKKKRKAKKQPRQTKIRPEILLDNFQEIVEFHAENGRLPTKNRQSDEIIEFMLASRLEGIRKDPNKIRLIKAKFPTESAIFFEAD